MTDDPTMGLNGEIRVQRVSAIKDQVGVQRLRIFMGLTHLGELKIENRHVDEFIRKIGAVEVRR